MHVLVTGGCGYIGSHTVVELLDAGHEVTVVDSLVNSSAASLRQVRAITGRPVAFVPLDLRDRDGLRRVFDRTGVDAVIHFAGLKAVGESVAVPVRYYDANLGSTLALVEAMADHGVGRLVFSSSATVYGDPSSVPIPEDAAIRPTNPYGRTKAMIESVLTDLAATGAPWQISLLRYFNPIGAHPSGDIGEDPTGVPNNLLPFVAQVAVGRRPELAVYGGDWDTPDGTGVRDYLHVVDLAAGHLAALDHLPGPGGCEAVNLGTGSGLSVLEVVHTFEQATGQRVPYRIVDRRPGDIATCFADPARARQRLGWEATRSFATACEDLWRWQSSHPEGFAGA